MKYHPEKVLPLLQKLTKEIELGKEVTELHFRDDYDDYLVILDDEFHCELREKLVNDYIEFKKDDVLREIVFRLEHAVEYEEWEKPEKATGGGGGEERIEIDDSDKYDF